jgi:hypothetical protein
MQRRKIETINNDTQKDNIKIINIITMTNFTKHVIIISILLFTVRLSGQSFLDADNTGNAYSRITAKIFGYEVPDCVHPVVHITEEWNDELNKFVFGFALHRDIDNDRCINFDRQRTEIKTSDASPDSMKAFLGETLFERWKFKLDSLFQPSTNFCHIHQLKAGDGPDADNPLITLSAAISGGNNELQIRFMAPITGTTSYLTRADLAPYLGIWVEAFEKVTFSHTGSYYSLTLKKVSNDSTMLTFTSSSLDLWRDTSTFMRPKWGFYRSLNSISYLRDEIIRFADFSLIKRISVTLPAAPSVLATSILTPNRIKLTWTDNANNEDQFRIDRSNNGSVWNYLACTSANIKTYTDTVSTGGTYYYRVRTENTGGNSAFSNTSSSTIALPVELISFTAAVDDRKVNLKWVTATEMNNYGFEIERSNPNDNSSSNWKSIAFIKGAGTSSMQNTYAYMDSPPEGTTFSYRIKQIDLSGGFRYYKSETVQISVPAKYSLDQNYPNPFNPNTVIRFQIPETGKVKLTLYNILGKEVSELINEVKEAGSYEVNFDSGKLKQSSGVYIYTLEVYSGDGSLAFRNTRKMTYLK